MNIMRGYARSGSVWLSGEEGAEIMVVHHRDNTDLEPPQMKRVRK